MVSPHLQILIFNGDGLYDTLLVNMHVHQHCVDVSQILSNYRQLHHLIGTMQYNTWCKMCCSILCKQIRSFPMNGVIGVNFHPMERVLYYEVLARKGMALGALTVHYSSFWIICCKLLHLLILAADMQLGENYSIWEMFQYLKPQHAQDTTRSLGK